MNRKVNIFKHAVNSDTNHTIATELEELFFPYLSKNNLNLERRKKCSLLPVGKLII
jgi:hypothetical protein